MSDRIWILIIAALTMVIVGNFAGHMWPVWLGYIIGAGHMLMLDHIEYKNLKAKIDATKVE